VEKFVEVEGGEERERVGECGVEEEERKNMKDGHGR